MTSRYGGPWLRGCFARDGDLDLLMAIIDHGLRSADGN
jgi:hypothetical protein